MASRVWNWYDPNAAEATVHGAYVTVSRREDGIWQWQVARSADVDPYATGEEGTSRAAAAAAIAATTN